MQENQLDEEFSVVYYVDNALEKPAHIKRSEVFTSVDH